MNLVEKMTGATCTQVANLLLEETSFSVCLGMAALNAGLLLEGVRTEQKPIQQQVVDMGQGGEVALVGQFPFTGWLRDRVEKLHLFELQPVEGRLPRDQWESTLERVKVAAVTSTVFLTRHAAYYLEQTRNAATIMIGPSTPLTPVLLNHGVNILAGSRVTDPVKIMHSMVTKGCFSEVVAAGGLEFVVMTQE